MLIAGEPSGDLLAAELVSALREKSSGAKFFGAGGPKMSAAGVELAIDMTRHTVIGITDVLKNYFKLLRLFNQLLKLAIKHKPDAIIGVDYGGFNLRFGHAVKEYARYDSSDWNPKIIQFVSPQVWASRPARADLLARDYDLLLSIFPFEKDWYARHEPKVRVEFVGHPMIGRYPGTNRSDDAQIKIGNRKSEIESQFDGPSTAPQILLLPGSRASELRMHLPVMLPALTLIRAKIPEAKAKIVLPDENLARLAKLSGVEAEIQIGNLPEALASADVAIASTGTVTMECAFFGVPTATLYKTSWLTFQIAKRMVTVESLTMPNLLAGRKIYPEYIQDAATPENLAAAALDLLRDQCRRRDIKSQIERIISSLGEPGASNRAAAAILGLFR